VRRARILASSEPPLPPETPTSPCSPSRGTGGASAAARRAWRLPPADELLTAGAVGRSALPQEGVDPSAGSAVVRRGPPIAVPMTALTKPRRAPPQKPDPEGPPSPSAYASSESPVSGQSLRRGSLPSPPPQPPRRLGGAGARSEPMLLPSAAPTPRATSADQGNAAEQRILSGFVVKAGTHLRPAVLCVPSGGPANDPARARNGGVPLTRLRGDRCVLGNAASAGTTWPTSPMRVSSVPALHIRAHSESPKAKTPRAARGMVRRVSKVLLNYPLATRSLEGSTGNSSRVLRSLVVSADDPSNNGDHESAQADRVVSQPPRSASAARSPRSTSLKRVSWAEEWDWDPSSPTGQVYSSKSLENGMPTPALQKSVRKMDALYGLRRCAKGGSGGMPALPTAAVVEDHLAEDAAVKVTATSQLQAATGTLPHVDADAGSGVVVSPAIKSDAAASGAPAAASGELAAAITADDSDEALMYAVLRDTEDTEAQLRIMESSMDSVLKECASAGGARHATALISGRILAVARRKASLLHDVEKRLAEFETAHARREDLLSRIVADTESAPEALRGVKKFIAMYTHSPGHPADENKSQFTRFASTFKLPRKHGVLDKFRYMAEEAGTWWAQACLNQAEKGHGHAVLRRLFDVALGTGVDEDHPFLVRAKVIINDRLAGRVLADAEDRQRKDAKAEERGNVPMIGQATAMADKIDLEIRAAVAEGVPETDPRLQQATAICKELRQKDFDRKRSEGRAKRLEAAARSASPMK